MIVSMNAMRRLLGVLVVSTVVAGCGGSEDSTPTVASAPQAAATASDTPLETGVTEGRTGDATSVTSGGDPVGLSRGGKPDPTEPVRTPKEAGIANGANCPDATLAPTADNLAAISAATLCIVNAERTAKGVTKLTANSQLAAAARAHSQDMVAKSYFAHDGQDGSTMTDRIAATGYLPRSGTWALGENLAWGTGSLATPRAIVNSWMNSKGHRANLLNARYREVGQGIVIGNPSRPNGVGGTYTHAFGFRSKPKSSESAAIPGVRAAGTTSARRVRAKISTTTVRRLQRRRCARFRGRSAKACKSRVARLARAASRP